MAKNDWIVAGINNPDFTTADFSNIAELSVDNTQLLSKEDYLKSDFIKSNPMFQDNNGKFSEQKFTDFYNQRVAAFGELQQGDFEKGPALDMFSIFRTKDTPIMDIKFDVRRGVNPDRQAIGIEGVNVWSDPVFSRREIAKQNKVYNYEAGKFEDYTVNDHTLVNGIVNWVKDLFKDPLVLATWDEDGEHVDPITGQVREHKKGDEKLNDKGTYYYETLGNRSVLGKDVLSVFDTFTVDGQGMNKYDFFDSNDIKKSVAGTVAKNIIALLPLFCGPIGTAYSTVLIAREMAKSLPMLYGMISAFSDAQAPTWVNRLATIGERTTMSTSDYAKQQTFAFENFGNLVADVATQWGQQKRIAQVFNKFKKSNNYIEEANRQAQALFEAKRAQYVGREAELWTVCQNRFLPQAQKLAEKSSQLGRDMSLAYMAIVSNTDVYQDALDHGTTKAEAAAITLGSTLGMFAIDKYAHLGEVFFDEATPDTIKQARRALKTEFAKARSAFDSISKGEAPLKNKLLQYITKAADVSKHTMSQFAEDLKYHSLNMLGKMVGEGLEELGEEIVADTSKSLYELAGQLGFNTSTKDVGAWDNAFDRYVMNFLGGFIGGGVFYGKEVWDGKSFHKPKLDQDIATLIRNGHADELREQLAIMQKEGKTGSKKLSVFEAPELTEDGTLVWRTTEDETQSQSQAIANLVADHINAVEEVLLANRVNLSDDELLENMILSEERYSRYNQIYGEKEKVATVTNLYDDFATVLNKLVSAEIDLRNASNTLEGIAEGGTQIPNDTALGHLPPEAAAKRAQNIANLTQAVEDARKEVHDFLSGNNALDYTRKLNFALDPMLHGPFLEVSKEEYFNSMFNGKSPDQIEPEALVKFEAVDWPTYVNEQLKTKLTDAYAKYKQFASIIDPHLDELSKVTPNYKQWVDKIPDLLSTGGPLDTSSIKYLTYDDKLDNESDDDYSNRNKKLAIDPLTGLQETDTAFAQRRRAREQKIEAQNEQIAKDWVDNIRTELQKVNMEVDPITAHIIRSQINRADRIRSIINRKIHYGTTNETLALALSSLNPDLSNSQDIIDSIRATVKAKAMSRVDDLLHALQNMTVEFKKQDPNDPNEAVRTETLSDFVANELMEPTPSLIEILDDFDLDSQRVEGTPEDNYFKELTAESQQEVRDAISNLVALQIDDLNNTSIGDCVDGVVRAISFETEIDNIAQKSINAMENEANAIIASIRNNPIFKLQSELKTIIKNPVGELLKKVAASNGDSIPDIDNILATIENNFEDIQDINQLQLDDVQKSQLLKARHYMELLSVYLYAASTVPNTNQPIGHNKTINAFADANTNRLIAPWNKLPEIDADYVSMYQQNIHAYVKAIDSWIELSDANAVKKAEKLIRIDAALNKALFEVLRKVTRTFTVGDQTYDLLKGYESIDQSALTAADTSLTQIPLFNLEKLFHDNIAEIAKAQKKSIFEFVKDSKLLETLVPGFADLDNQRSTAFTDSLTEKDLTDYTKLQYFITLLSDNPANFFAKLRDRVTANKQIAPITVQEYSTRVAQAALTQDFKDLVQYASSQMKKLEVPVLMNTVIIPGVAGAGKTQVILNAIDSILKGSPVLIAAPTTKQASAMQKAMGRDSSMTFEQLMELILGKKWQNIRSDLNTVKKTESDYKGNYFTITEGSDGLMKVSLTAETLSYLNNNFAEPPKAIYLDEATHLSTVQALIIDAFAKKIGATVYMCGDLSQIGYVNGKSGIQNIDEGAVFATRTPNLTVSLRDNNIQKYTNQEAVRSVLEQVINSRLYDTESDYNDFFSTVKNWYSHFNFRIYDSKGLTGDLISKTLEDATIVKLKEAYDQKKSIAFIGDKTSVYLQKLKDAGVDINDEDVLSMSTMQGQEYDYVVIDQEFTAPKEMPEARVFLQKLYTLMTRAREASVFISDTLEDIIGKNVNTQHTAKVPPITASVDRLREQKLKVLDQLDLSSAAVSTSTSNVKTTNTTNQSIIINEEDMFKDPDNTSNSKKNTEIQSITDISMIDSVTSGDELDRNDSHLPININDPNIINNFPIECYGDAWTLGITQVEKDHVEKHKATGEDVKADSWTITEPPGDGPLRNLQAIVGKQGKKVFWYKDKITLQTQLAKVRSVILFDHEYEDESAFGKSKFPKFIRDYFTKDEWNKGKYELEFRAVTDSDVRPLHSNMRETGFEYTIDRKRVRIIANIVYSVKNKDGRVCKFDLAGINNPDTLQAKNADIKKNLQARINTIEDDNDPVKQKLQNALANIDNTTASYKNWFENQLRGFLAMQPDSQKLDANITKVIDLPTSAIRKNHTTWFKRVSNVMRLGDNLNLDQIIETNEIDPNTGRKKLVYRTDVNSFIAHNSDKVFSPVYTYSAETEEVFDQLPQSLKGKAVIFVSADATLDSNDLVNIYLAQKENPSGNDPVVRMLVLNNYGMTFSQLNDKTLLQQLVKGDESRKPFNMSFIGMRMFASLWNARAALINFNNALAKWQADNKYSDSQITALIKAQDCLYRASSESDATEKTKLEGEAENLLKTANLKREDLVKLTDFNDNICKEIPMFRLGYTRNENGFHIQRFNVAGSMMYSTRDASGRIIAQKDAANQCVVTPEKAKQFLGLLEEVIKPIVPRKDASIVSDISTLGLEFTREVKDKNGKTNVVRWEPEEYLDWNDTKHRRSLSGLLKWNKDNYTIIVTDGVGSANPVTYTEGMGWSAIPRILSDVLKSVQYYQYNSSQITNPASLVTKVSYHTGKADFNQRSTDKDADLKKIEIGIGAFFSDGSTPGLLAETTTVNGVQKIDDSLANLFDLIFHGTIEDIHDKSKKHMQMDDAYFKDGFLINPDLLRKKVSAGELNVNRVLDTKDRKKVLFYEIGTPLSLFTVDVEMRSSGMQILLGELMNPTGDTTQTGNPPQGPTTQGPTTTETPKETLKREHPVEYSIIASLNAVADRYEYTMDTLSIDGVIDEYNDTCKRGIAAELKQKGLEQILEVVELMNNRPYMYHEGKLLTVRDYVFLMAKANNFDNPTLTFDPITKQVKYVCNASGDVYYLVDPNMSSGEFITLVRDTSGSSNTQSTNAPTSTTENIPASKFDVVYDQNTGETLRDAFLNTVNTKSFKENVLENNSVTEKTFNECIKALENALGRKSSGEPKVSPAKTEELLTKILNNEDYADILTAIDDEWSDLFNKVFNEC